MASQAFDTTHAATTTGTHSDTGGRLPPTPVTADELLDVVAVVEPRHHPQQPLIAYTVEALVTEHRRRRTASRIWLVGSDGAADDAATAHPITAPDLRAHAPRWSPDGRTLAFLATREPDGSDQVWLLRDGWGDAEQLTHAPGGVRAAEWLPDGSGLLLLATDAPAAEKETEHAAGRDWTVAEEGHRFTRIYDCAPDGTLTLRSTADAEVYEFDAHQRSDGSLAVVALIADEPYAWGWYSARLALLSDDGTFSTLHSSQRQYTQPRWSPDGQQIAVIHSTFSDQGMTGGDVLLLTPAAGPNREATARTLTPGHPRSYLSAQWEATPDGSTRLLCNAVEDGQATLGWLTLEGEWQPLLRREAAINRWGDPLTCGVDGTYVLAIGQRDAPADIVTLRLDAPLADADQPWVRRSDHHAVVRARQVARSETVHWTAGDGATVQGILVRALDDDGTPRPTIVQIHGGPTGLWAHDFPAARSTGWVPLLAARGYHVFLPNPRGSMGFGRAWAEANIGDMGGGDWHDIMAGVDALVERGIADPNRLGVCGWSYGGYLSAWAVTQTNRFKAAVSGATITNWISFHGTSPINGFDIAFYPGPDVAYSWDGPYGQFSPIAHVRNVRTPTLFLHGEQDPVCPVGQAWEMWRALKERGVPTQLVVYPREGHGIRERAHARDVLLRTVDWLAERV